MTFEELEICSFELRRRGFRSQWRFGSHRQGWRLRARLGVRGDAGWYKDAVIELIDADDLAPYMLLPLRR